MMMPHNKNFTSSLIGTHIVFIHLYSANSASHSMSLSEALPTTAINTMSEFTRRSATSNCKWRTCSKVLTWRL